MLQHIGSMQSIAEVIPLLHTKSLLHFMQDVDWHPLLVQALCTLLHQDQTSCKEDLCMVPPPIWCHIPCRMVVGLTMIFLSMTMTMTIQTAGSPLELACRNGHAQVAKAMFALVAPIDHEDKVSLTPLLLLPINCDLEIVANKNLPKLSQWWMVWDCYYNGMHGRGCLSISLLLFCYGYG